MKNQRRLDECCHIGAARLVVGALMLVCATGLHCETTLVSASAGSTAPLTARAAIDFRITVLPSIELNVHKLSRAAVGTAGAPAAFESRRRARRGTVPQLTVVEPSDGAQATRWTVAEP